MQLSIPKIPEPLIIWEKIEILTSFEANAGVYFARIEDFENEGLLITKPEFIKGDSLLRDNCNIIIQATKSDAIYFFESTIQKKEHSSHQQYFLSNPKFVKRVQRREFARLVYSTPLQYTLFNAQFKTAQKWDSSCSWDISGNGMLFEVNDSIKQHALVLLKINLFDELQIGNPILGLSQRILLDNKTRLCGMSLIIADQFNGFEKKYPISKIKNLKNNFDSQAQEKLVSFIFQQEINRRKKGNH